MRLFVAVLFACLAPVIFAEESASPAVEQLVASVRFKQDNYASGVAADNIDQHPEHDLSGLSSAMKSQQDAGIAAAEIISHDDSHDVLGMSEAGKMSSQCSDATIDNTVSQDAARIKRFSSTHFTDA